MLNTDLKQLGFKKTGGKDYRMVKYFNYFKNSFTSIYYSTF